MTMAIGFFSTVHCVGMCGGIVSAFNFSLPASPKNQWEQRLLYNLAYHTGRIGSYTLIGALLAFMGQAAITRTSPQWGYPILQALSALIMMAMGLYLGGWFPQLAKIETMGLPLWQRLQPLRRWLLPVRSPFQAFGMGIVWGWLPCGLVYSMLLGSALQGSVVAGTLYMLGFGLGTLLPLLMVGLFSGQLIGWARHPGVRQWIGGSLLLMACLLLGLAWVNMQTGLTGQSCHPPVST